MYLPNRGASSSPRPFCGIFQVETCRRIADETAAKGDLCIDFTSTFTCGPFTKHDQAAVLSDPTRAADEFRIRRKIQDLPRMAAFAGVGESWRVSLVVAGLLGGAQFWRAQVVSGYLPRHRSHLVG